MDSLTPNVSPLRQRMIEDMRMRKMGGKTQEGYIRAVRRLTGYLKRSPETASVEDLRNFQLHLVDTGTSPVTLNATLTGLTRERQDQIAFALLLILTGLMVRMLLRPKRPALATAAASSPEPPILPVPPIQMAEPVAAPVVVAASPTPVMTATVVDMRNREGSGKHPIVTFGRT
mgnify:CR=1 FL=1